MITKSSGPWDEGLGHNTSKLPPLTKVMAEGEGNLGWMMEEGEDEPYLWPRDQPQQWVIVHPINLF